MKEKDRSRRRQGPVPPIPDVIPPPPPSPDYIWRPNPKGGKVKGATRAAKIVVRYSEKLVPAGDTKALIALASGPLAEVGMRVIGVILPKPKKEEDEDVVHDGGT